MIEFYPQLKFAHVLCVVLSGSLFALRGAMMLANSALANHWTLRFASYTINTALLTAALMLVVTLHQYPFVQPWLTVKVMLIAVYVALGSIALRSGRTRAQRTACFGAALAIFLFIASIAHAHNPLGLLALLFA